MVDVGKRECGIVGVKFDSENQLLLRIHDDI